jgi:predicted secreted Zn-dependent protease
VAATINARTEAGSVATAIVSQDFDIRDQGGPGEKVVAARIQVSQVVELPVWTDKSQAPAKMQAEWNRFSGALAAHEAGHVQKDVGGFAGAHTKAIGKNNADADAAIAGVEAATTKANADYDTATDHGRNAGTKLQTNLGQVIKVP